jgi:hypothetical protein
MERDPNKWHLCFTDGRSQPFDTKFVALMSACIRIRVAHHTVLKLEGPHAPPMDLAAIQRWCEENRNLWN